MKGIHIIHVFIKAHTDNNIIKLDTINKNFKIHNKYIVSKNLGLLLFVIIFNAF